MIWIASVPESADRTGRLLRPRSSGRASGELVGFPLFNPGEDLFILYEPAGVRGSDALFHRFEEASFCFHAEGEGGDGELFRRAPGAGGDVGQFSSELRGDADFHACQCSARRGGPMIRLRYLARVHPAMPGLAGEVTFLPMAAR